MTDMNYEIEYGPWVFGTFPNKPEVGRYVQAEMYWRDGYKEAHEGFVVSVGAFSFTLDNAWPVSSRADMAERSQWRYVLWKDKSAAPDSVDLEAIPA